MDLDREAQRKKYIRKFNKYYKNIPREYDEKKKELIERLAHLALTLDECQFHLENEGNVTEMSQGSYTIMRENPYSKVHDRTMKTFLSVMSKLDEMLPGAKESTAAAAGEALAGFVAKGKKLELR